MKKLLKISFAALAMVSVIITGCSKDNIEYGEEIGTVEGKIEFEKEEPEIVLSNIKSYVGEEIDFLSGIDIGNVDESKDMEIWVDTSLVDIFTPGDYKATYTFKYGNKEYTQDIVVTIIEKEGSKESTGVSNAENQETIPAGQNSSGQQSSVNASGGNGQQSSTDMSGGNGQQSSTDMPNGNGQQSGESKPNGNGQQSTTKKQNITATTTKRQIVTSAGNATTEYKELGYYSIELLSGKTVKLKSTTSKYIVSTHTDVSYVNKDSGRYKVSKLIVNFSDGTSSVLETAEEKLK